MSTLSVSDDTGGMAGDAEENGMEATNADEPPKPIGMKDPRVEKTLALAVECSEQNGIRDD